MQKNNARFIQRFIAIIIDVVLVSLIAQIISIPFINDSNIQKLTDSRDEVLEKYNNKEIDIKTATVEYANITYEISKDQGVFVLVTVVLEMLYFMVYQFYTKGQTIGKKIMKIKVVSNKGELSMNDLVLRSLLIDFILFDFMEFVIITFVGDPISSVGLQVICEGLGYLIIIISCLMVMYSKNRRGLHDLVADTSVVNI